MLPWQRLVTLPEEDLGRIDVAEVNLACAEGLPGCESTLTAASRRSTGGPSASERKPTGSPGTWQKLPLSTRTPGRTSALSS